MSTYVVPGQYERTQAARLAVAEAQARIDAELQNLVKLAENEGYSGFAILYLGPDLIYPVEISQLHGRVWIGSYADEKLDSTLFLGVKDPRCEALQRAHGTWLKAQDDCRRVAKPILPTDWRGSSHDDVENLPQLRNYLRNVLSCSRAKTSQAHKLYPLADVLFNVDNTLVLWGVANCPKVSPEPKSDDEAHRALLRKLQWLNSVVEQENDESTTWHTGEQLAAESTSEPSVVQPLSRVPPPNGWDGAPKNWQDGNALAAQYKRPNDFFRDAWLYLRREAGVSNPELLVELLQNAKRFNWVAFNRPGDLISYTKSFAEFMQLPWEKKSSGPKPRKTRA